MHRSGWLIAVTAAALFGSGCAAQTTSSAQTVGSPASTVLQPAGIPAHEPRFGRDRPVIAVLAHHEGAEVTDFMVPYGILATAGVAEVVAVSTGEGPIEMFPALTIEADATTAQFDRAYPAGADYVIVPAVHRPDAAELQSWILEQAARGAHIVGVCDGVLVLASAGLLEGRRATGHWFSMGRLARDHPGTTWVRNQRYVADGNVITTTGVSASVPVSLALVEAIAGTQRAEQVAGWWGVEDWSAAHDSESYGLTAGHVLTWLGNTIAFWRDDRFAIDVQDGVDEVTLALFADAWSRTSRSSVVTRASAEGPVLTRGGLRLVPEGARTAPEQPERAPSAIVPLEPLSTLDAALAGIADAYGHRTAAFVALQLEYPWSSAVPALHGR